MRFLRRPKFPLHANMHLLLPALKPAATPRPQRLRLLQLPHSQNPAIKLPRRRLATFRRSHLNMIDAKNAHFRPSESIANRIQFFRATNRLAFT